MSSRRSSKSHVHALTMHAWTAKHYVFVAVIVLLAVGMFALSWS